ncbi:MAG: DUF1415 domain-containing protein [Chitinophagaceae bacterium]|nr:DUF1415 domain-containing protein [Chitinophagaceae bacterium]
MNSTELIIEQTKKWITDVVIACNFCPFAAREVKQNRVYYAVELSSDPGACLHSFLQECRRLDDNAGIETSLLIMPNAVPLFETYLDMVAAAEKLLEKNKYEGIYQVASFHPLYRFDGTPANDAANYTNRSPYPMLHLLREESIEKALEKYNDPEEIPERNIAFAREKGPVYMQMLLDACMK